MKGLAILVIVALSIAVLIEAAAIGGAWWLHRQGRIADEIEWLQSFQPVMKWDRALDGQIDRLYRERVRQELNGDRLDRAVQALRWARARYQSRGLATDPDLTSLGIETFTRAADRMEAHGRLDLAADWDDSLFVFAVRAKQPHHRFAAVAAFVEGLDLRVRAGDPCSALDRVLWARRGLGGEIPGFQPSVEEDLRNQCRGPRRNRRG
jgi:hypothetical protein